MNTKTLFAFIISLLLIITLFLSACLEHEFSQNQKLSQAVKSLKEQQQQLTQQSVPMNSQQPAPNQQFMKRSAQDQGKYSQQQLNEAESLYQVANHKWGTPEAIASLKEMVQKYPGINRTGCAELYLAQMSQGDDRARYLQDCISNYNDSTYGDGVVVGVYARFLLAQDYQTQGNNEKAQALFDEIKTKYPDAVDHAGNLLRNSIK